MTDNGDGRALLRPGQSTREATGGWGEIVQAIRNAVWLFARRCVEVAWVAVVVPLLAGPWVLVAYVPWAYERGVLQVADWLGYDDTDIDHYSLIALGAVVLLALLLLPDAALAWWPFWWQRSRSNWFGLQMAPGWLLVRFVLIVAPWRAWTLEEPHLTNRQRQEVVAPTLSGVAFSTPDPHLVEIPGVLNPHRDPEAPPIVQVQPTRIAPLRVAANARPVRTIELPFGGAVEVGRLVAMLEADEGFSWRTWRRHSWTRSDWETACGILMHAGIISEPQSGKTTERLVSVDEAIDRIEDMG